MKSTKNYWQKNINSGAALTASSEMLAGKLVIEYLSKTTNSFFHFPTVHHALMNPLSIPVSENGKLNSKIFNSTISKITILTDVVQSQNVVPIDRSLLLSIPKEIKINLASNE